MQLPPARPLVTAAFLTAVVVAWLNGIVARTVTANVSFFTQTATRDDYRVAAGAGVMTALLLVLAMVAVRGLRTAAWLDYVTGAGIATQLALGVTAWWSSRPVENTDLRTTSVWDGVADVFLLPGSWPLLLLLVVAAVVAVRGRSSPAPR